MTRGHPRGRPAPATVPERYSELRSEVYRLKDEIEELRKDSDTNLSLYRAALARNVVLARKLRHQEQP